MTFFIFKITVSQSLKNRYICLQKWQDDIRDSPPWEIYNTFKTKFGFEKNNFITTHT